MASTAKRPGAPHKERPLKKKRKPKPPPKVSLIDEKSDWNGHMFPFKGTSTLFTEESHKQISDFEDDEWEHHSGVSSVKVNNSLGSLMAAYGSDCDNASDNEPPEEIKIVKSSSNEPSSTDIVVNQQPSTSKLKRKRVHQKKPQKSNKDFDNAAVPSTSTGITRRTDKFPHNHFRRRKVTLLEKLLESEIRHERNLLLQCVRYVVDNNFFRASQ